MKKLVSLVFALMLILSCSADFAEGEKVTIQFWHSMSGTNSDSIDHIGPPSPTPSWQSPPAPALT